MAVLAVCSVSYVLLFIELTEPETGGARSASSLAGAVSGGRPSFGHHHHPLSGSLSLTEAQCRAAFPDLSKPIDDQIGRGPFELQPAADLGPLLARVRDGQLRIVSAEKAGVLPPELMDARMAALHQIHRALMTAADQEAGSLDTVFALNIQDQPFGSAWTYSLPAYAAPPFAGIAPIGRSFLMPHFSFWAWRPPMVGSVARAADAIALIEDDMGGLRFADKDPRVVWRGTTRFASAFHPKLRQQLVAATHGQPWADVQALDWKPEEVYNASSATTAVNPEAMQEASNSLPIEDFCRYKYIIHTEGITYSGRFQFHQLCRSVVLTPPIAWMQHTTHLAKPLYASDLDLEYLDDIVDSKSPEHHGVHRRWKPTADEEAAWPHAAPGEANIVFVAPDWSNLGATVRWLERHPAVAEGIAARQRALFADGGYLSPAAETCYWRSLLRGWRQVVQYNDSALCEGEPWETFVLGPG